MQSGLYTYLLKSSDFQLQFKILIEQCATEKKMILKK
jgi:hypothetical protein